MKMTVKIIPDVSEYLAALDFLAKSPKLIQAVLDGSIDLNPRLEQLSVRRIGDAFDVIKVDVLPSVSLSEAVDSPIPDGAKPSEVFIDDAEMIDSRQFSESEIMKLPLDGKNQWVLPRTCLCVPTIDATWQTLARQPDSACVDTHKGLPFWASIIIGGVIGNLLGRWL